MAINLRCVETIDPMIRGSNIQKSSRQVKRKINETINTTDVVYAHCTLNKAPRLSCKWYSRLSDRTCVAHSTWSLLIQVDLCSSVHVRHPRAAGLSTIISEINLFLSHYPYLRMEITVTKVSFEKQDFMWVQTLQNSKILFSQNF